MVPHLDLIEILLVDIRSGLVMLFFFLPGSSIKDIFINLDRCLYNLILKASMDGDAAKLFWYTDPVFNPPFS